MGSLGYENLNNHMIAQVLCNIIVALMALCLFLYAGKIEAPTFYTSLTIDQMVTEWQEKPWVSMTVGDSLGNCPDGTEPMFSNTWQGTVEGASIKDNKGNYQVITYDDWMTNSTYDKMRSKWKLSDTIPANQAVKQVVGVGVGENEAYQILCGVRGGSSFAEV